MPPRLILNADDLGWSVGVNDAIFALYDEGVVTSTSLMVGAPAAGDAVTRLESRPELAVGLHLALVGAPPLLPPGEVPRLVDATGVMPPDCAAAGIRATLLPPVRRELDREMEAQFRAFDALGLGWSHVDSHMHFSLTPVVFRRMLALCRRYRPLGLRVPQDDYRLYRRLDPEDAGRQRGFALWFDRMCRRQRRLLHGEPFRLTRRCYGFFRSGRLEVEYLERLVDAMPDGDLELHCHPDLSTDGGRAEFEALRSPRFRSALEERGVVLSTYRSLQA